MILDFFLRTQLGLSLRACGDNEDMVRASSIDTDKMKILGLALANGLVAMSGAVFAQHQSFADISSGTGMMVIGLASIIVGTTFIKKEKIIFQLVAVVFGAISLSCSPNSCSTAGTSFRIFKAVISSSCYCGNCFN